MSKPVPQIPLHVNPFRINMHFTPLSLTTRNSMFVSSPLPGTVAAID